MTTNTTFRWKLFFAIINKADIFPKLSYAKNLFLMIGVFFPFILVLQLSDMYDLRNNGKTVTGTIVAINKRMVKSGLIQKTEYHAQVEYVGLHKEFTIDPNNPPEIGTKITMKCSTENFINCDMSPNKDKSVWQIAFIGVLSILTIAAMTLYTKVFLSLVRVIKNAIRDASKNSMP